MRADGLTAAAVARHSPFDDPTIRRGTSSAHREPRPRGLQSQTALRSGVHTHIGAPLLADPRQPRLRLRRHLHPGSTRRPEGTRRSRHRPQGPDGGSAGPARRAHAQRQAHRVPRSGRAHRPDVDVGSRGTRRRLRRLGDSARPLSGSGFRAPGRPPSRATTLERSIRNVAYALLSGADGWMFDGEDALGQVTSMSLDNQRNLKLAVHRDERFLAAAEAVAAEMNAWAEGFLGRRIVLDWRPQLDFTTRIFRPRGLHLDDRHLRHDDGVGLLRVDRRRRPVRRQQSRADAQHGIVDRSVPAQDSDGRRSRALERPAHGAGVARGAAARHDQDIRARRADRGEFPADGDSRRAAIAVRRLQYRPMGLHQQRL